jgi:glycosyltransferase involved in cell wall biosynthesis
MDDAITIVICNFNLPRELPRTLYSLSPNFQIDIDKSEYEILIVDNGSSELPDTSTFTSLDIPVRLISFPSPSVSPVRALNFAVAQTNTKFVCVFIDGARMASPRLIASGLEALRINERSVVGCRGRYLGHTMQIQAIQEGYTKVLEDENLRRIDWMSNGYKLFEISVPDESAGESLLDTPSESNALFMSRKLWDEIGGYNENFSSPGGGYANLEIWSRATTLNNVRTILLIGETTFHQLHGGVATNAMSPEVQENMHNEYRSIVGKSYIRPIVKPYFYGNLYRKLLSEAEELTKPLRAYWERDEALLKLSRFETGSVFFLFKEIVKSIKKKFESS